MRPRRVRGTSHADHSRRLRPIADQLAADVAAILTEARPNASTLVVSTVTGAPADVAALRSGAHWAAHMTQRVEYVRTARFLAGTLGVATFVEIGDGMLGRVTLPTVKPLLPGGRATSFKVRRYLPLPVPHECSPTLADASPCSQIDFLSSGVARIDPLVYSTTG